MAARTPTRKMVDEIARVRCAAGNGVIREEVWVDESGAVVRYNLAFINHFLTRADNGRVLGYDNRHGAHHKHVRGNTEPFAYLGYDLLVEQFLAEVDLLRKEKI